MEKTDDLVALRDALRQFCDARDWRQYHSPKNLAMALIVEAAELVEHFQWLTPEQSMVLVWLIDAHPDHCPDYDALFELVQVGAAVWFPASRSGV